MHIWSLENPHTVRETQLHPQKIGVWIAISLSQIIGLFDRTVILKFILMRYCLILFPNSMKLKQDNATVHNSNRSMKFLEEIFGGRIISQELWSSRSPDLTPPIASFGLPTSQLFTKIILKQFWI